MPDAHRRLSVKKQSCQIKSLPNSQNEKWRQAMGRKQTMRERTKRAADDAAPPKKKGKKKPAVDAREQLVNDGKIGRITDVSVPLEMITSLQGILLDVDPLRYRREVAPIRQDPRKFYERTLSKMLARHPVLSKAEVRVSGQGLHVIVRLRDPVEFESDADRQRWAGMVKTIQRLLPTDPDCPGISALTRPIGSVNSKNGAVVRLLRKGQPVPVEEIIALFKETRSRPFRTIAQLLFGQEHITPCPVCALADSRLNVLDHKGSCYGHCGTVRISQLFDVFLKPRPTKK
jgi:hypothetical protein